MIHPLILMAISTTAMVFCLVIAWIVMFRRYSPLMAGMLLLLAIVQIPFIIRNFYQMGWLS